MDAETTRRIEIPGGALAVEIRGADDGLPVLLVHGFPFSRRMWEPQLDALTGFRLIAPDLRGHGASPVGDGQYAIDLFVDDVIALLDALGVERVVGCGLSMGGYVLLRALEREPERFQGAVLCDTRSEADTDEARLRRVAAVRRIRAAGPRAFAQEFVPGVVAPSTLREKPEVVERIREIVAANPVRGMVGAQLAMAARTDTSGALPGIRVPTLVVVGEHDEITPPEGAREMARRIPGAGFTVIPAAAHLPNLENPRDFTHALGSFLEGLQAPP